MVERFYFGGGKRVGWTYTAHEEDDIAPEELAYLKNPGLLSTI